MIDLHAHVLPDIDDGPRTEEEALVLLQAMQQDGISALTVTPHYMPGAYEPSKQEILRRIDQLQPRIPEIRLLPGTEVYLEHTSLERVRAGVVFTVGDLGTHLLVELPMGQLPLYTWQALSKLQAGQIIPILAHPERNPALMANRKEVTRIRDLGVLFQMDAASITGDNGPKVQRWSRSLLDQNLVDFVASDSHSLRRRPPQLQKAMTVARAWGWDLTPLVRENPAVILGEGERLQSAWRITGETVFQKLALRFR